MSRECDVEDLRRSDPIDLDPYLDLLVHEALKLLLRLFRSTNLSHSGTGPAATLG